MVPSAPTSIGTNSAFSLHSFPNSMVKSWYLSILSCYFTMISWSPGVTMSMIKQLFTILLMHTISSYLCSITLLVWIGKSCKILHPSSSSTELVICSYHLSLRSRWNFLHSSQLIFFATLSWFSQYWFLATLGQTLNCVRHFQRFRCKICNIEFRCSCQCYSSRNYF